MKKWYQSKTVGFNILAILIAIGGYFSEVVDLNAGLTAGIIAIINIVLRFTTREAIL
ncbi:MAG: hypothetical protein ACYDBV_12940 [Nitrospiria bacterium]